jgi:transketolase
MGDGEQQKGQPSEARRFAIKYKLHSLTALIDNNQLQISGSTHDVMPQNIKANYQSDGWRVIEIDGHDFTQIYEALYDAVHDQESPVAIIAKTVMGKGVTFMENDAKYHGVALNEAQYEKAMNELSLPPVVNLFREKRNNNHFIDTQKNPSDIKAKTADIMVGEPLIYGKDDRLDNRSAFGNALKNIAELNKKQNNSSLMAVIDCDLVGSVKTNGFQSVLPQYFFQAGIQEHNAATIAGALSTQDILTFFADFGVFGICETYNQQRLNDINNSNLKLICTHIGLDVGEDGKTHQCIDYIGLFQNLFGYKILLPADPNQTDKATRYMSKTPGNFLLGMGRSKIPVIVNESGRPFFGDGYKFTYGKIDVVREGNDAVIMTYGGMLHRAVQAWEILRQKQISVQVLNVCCPKDPEEAALINAAGIGPIITYEDHNVHTGLGSIVASRLLSMNLSAQLIMLGIKGYGLSGGPDELYKSANLDVDSLVRTVEMLLKA